MIVDAGDHLGLAAIGQRHPADQVHRSQAWGFKTLSTLPISPCSRSAACGRIYPASQWLPEATTSQVKSPAHRCLTAP